MGGTHKHVRGGEVWFDDNPEGAEPTAVQVVRDKAVAYRKDWREIENTRGALLGCVSADAIADLVLGQP